MATNPLGANTYHTVVFGSGLAGLSCARKLALSKKRVCVIEKASQLGGHIPSFQRNGVLFEVGVHYIAAAQNGSLFAQSCAELNIQPEFIPLDPFFERMHNEGSGLNFEINSSFASFTSDLIQKFPLHKKAIQQFASDANTLWDFANTLRFPLTQWSLVRALLKSPHRFRLARIAFSSLHAYLHGALHLPHEACEIISLQHLLVGTPPKKLSAAIFLLVHRYYFENPGFIKGGGRWLTHALMHNDVRYILNEEATIEKSGQHSPARFCVHTSQGILYAQNIVWTPDPRLFSESSKISLGFWKRLQLQFVKNPHALAVAYFATKKPLDELGMKNANHWLMGTLNSENTYNMALPLNTLANNSPLFISTGSLRDPMALDPAGPLGAQGAFQAMFLVPNNSELWGVPNSASYKAPESRGGSSSLYKRNKEGALEIVKTRIVEAFPLLKENLCFQELGTPLTHERYLFSRSRTGYGFAPTVMDLLFWRPSYKTPTPGLYLCGAHIKPAHGIATTLQNGVGLAKILEKTNDA
jgi:phytoene dehydrogenase-like protein